MFDFKGVNACNSHRNPVDYDAKVWDLRLKSQLLNFRKFWPTRPERAEAPSPGHRPRVSWAQTCRPVRAKALKYRALYKAFALTGRLADCHYTQGDALG